MFAAQMAKHCGINLWYPNSECVRATSADPEGPYALAEVVVDTYAAVCGEACGELDQVFAGVDGQGATASSLLNASAILLSSHVE